MSEDYDFDKHWLSKLSNNVADVVGEENSTKILEGSENISKNSSREEVFEWTTDAMDKLEALTTKEDSKQIMLSCACHQPEEALQPFKELYEETGNIDLVLEKMQIKFEKFIRDALQLEDKYVQEIIRRKMGFAGIREGNKIIATKIPKSAFIKQWFEESDSSKKRALFCHCPRIRDVLEDETKILPKEYCYCGGGYYKHIWETIPQKPVEIEILQTAMHGDEVCQYAIHLPEL